MSRLLRALRRRLANEDGFTIVEALVALTVLTFASTGLAVTTGHGLRLVGTSQERQTAVQVANEWMEQARVVPFSGLALPDPTTFSGAGTPDAGVSGDGTIYASPEGDETLVFLAGSTFDHTPEEEVNGVVYTAYRYVTWVPDGANAQAYKRVTVVVQWDGTSTDGQPLTVTLSSIVAGDGIGWTSTTSTSSTSTTTTTPEPTTTTTAPPGTCDGDVDAPTGSLAILAGSGATAGHTSSPTVTLALTADDTCLPLEMAFSNDGTTFSAPTLFDDSAVWTLLPGDGTRTMWIRYTDGIGNARTLSASVVVDATKPTTPGSFTATVLNAPGRVVLTWQPSTDAEGVAGYRIYVAKGVGAFQNQPTGVSHPCSTSPCTWTHTGVKNKDTYTYYVVAYDKAGNESIAPTPLTRTI